MDRPALLCRQLAYYAATGFSGEIVIADGSSVDNFQVVDRWLRQSGGRPSVRHAHLPGVPIAPSVRQVTAEIQTPYVALIPDDDFLVPSAIDRCVALLDADSGFVAARGWGVVLAGADDRPDVIATAGPYRQPAILDATALDRVINHLRSYSVTVFSVHRREIWEKVWRATPSPADGPLVSDVAFCAELLPCSLTVAYGRVASIDCLYLVRQHHGARYLLPNWFQWLTNERWRPSYEWYRDHVAAAVSETDGISLAAARDAVAVGFSGYLERGALKGRMPALSTAMRARRLALRLLSQPGRRFIKRARAAFDRNHISLEGLLSARSPHRQEFLTIYNAVTHSNGAQADTATDSA